jgi:hypothetical protein
MPLTDEQIRGLDVLLNEAVLIDVQLGHDRARLGLTLYVEMAPAAGERDPRDLYLQLVLEPVSRVAASFRHAAGWDDTGAAAERLEPADLRGAVRAMHHHDALFGGRFFDVPESEGFSDWGDRLSLDLRLGEPLAAGHDLTLWSEDLVEGRALGRRPLLDVRVWFGDLAIRDRHGRRVDVDAAIAAARRYWEQVVRRGSGGPSPYPVPYVEIALPESGSDDQPAAEELAGGTRDADRCER